jgi:hypothetical protein
MANETELSKQYSQDKQENLPLSFEPDILLAAQYSDRFQRQARLDPEKRLMLAVLEDVVFCFQKYILSRKPRGRALFREAEDWILDEENDYIYSFWNSCEVLGLDSHYLRSGLLRWKEIKLRKTPKVRASPGSREEPQIARFNSGKNKRRERMAAR